MPKVGFRNIADGLRRSIEAGEIGPERALPSEAELMEQHGVARTTVRRALTLLQDEGLIEVVPGRGRFARAGTAPAVARTEKKYERVTEEIRRLLAAEGSSPGDRLGTVDELADRFGVSTGTTNRALAALETEGLITSVQSQGWFVGDLGGEANRTDAVAGRIRAAISDGEFPAGGSLPGEADLAEQHGVSRTTVRRALAALEAEGLIETRPGRRRLVLPGPEGRS
ncbi:GntR family transcriptional regulator [Actinomadura macrotermitis]|uniref:Transcriptional regulator NanR n=1 Tax=Actinomadura macrotermitis TaxID=2585200 RepID=A0A7K0BY63_9ACTN|nr:GntR family transcriptional regulator [Actinomadura macrotermitis]MQY06125.1 Transcriptional regulator NanR [Actinomadura macrotermitis]